MNRAKEIIRIMEKLVTSRKRRIKENHSKIGRRRVLKEYMPTFDDDKNAQYMCDGYLEAYFDGYTDYEGWDSGFERNPDAFDIDNLEEASRKLVYNQCRELLYAIRDARFINFDEDRTDYYELGKLFCYTMNGEVSGGAYYDKDWGVDIVEFEKFIKDCNKPKRRFKSLPPYITKNGNVGLGL